NRTQQFWVGEATIDFITVNTDYIRVILSGGLITYPYLPAGDIIEVYFDTYQSSLISQDNIRTVKGFTTASSNFLDMVSAINTLANYNVGETELISFQTSIIDPDDILNTAIITINTKNIGKGNYGVGGTQLTGNHLWIAGTRR